MMSPLLKFKDCFLNIQVTKKQATFSCLYTPEEGEELADAGTIQECVLRYIIDALADTHFTLENPVFELQYRLVDVGYNIYMYADLVVRV